MQIIFMTALGVGGATMIGAVIGFIFKGISQKFSDAVLSFAAGVMLAASVMGLVEPSLEYGGRFAPVTAVCGIFLGALCINLLDRTVPFLYRISGIREAEKNQERVNRILIFVMAIAIHNFPEGIAAGVGFGGGDTAQALLVAGAIALQNIPEGMVIIAPLLSTGMSPKRTFLCAISTGVIEIIGTLTGYYAVSISNAILPFALSFAGGTMIYVISDEMIPEIGGKKSGAYFLLVGFCLMLVMNFYLS